jgi:hypothetical protein
MNTNPDPARHVFGSRAWVEGVHTIVRELMANSLPARTPYSLSEHYTDPPPHLAAQAPLGWHMIVRGRNLELGHGPLEGADRHTVIDYALAAELAPVKLADNPAGIEFIRARVAAAIEHGLVQSTGPASSEVFPSMAPLHDRIAEITKLD